MQQIRWTANTSAQESRYGTIVSKVSEYTRLSSASAAHTEASCTPQ